MRLEQVVLHRYGQFDHLELDIPAEAHTEFDKLRLTLIVGENGTGKTTIFRFLTDIFDRTPPAKMDGCSVSYRLRQSHRVKFGGEPPEEGPSGIVISTYSPADGFSRIKDSGRRLAPLKYIGLDAERVARGWRSGPSRPFLKDVVRALLGEGEMRDQVSLLLDRIGYTDQMRLHLSRATNTLSERLERLRVRQERLETLWMRLEKVSPSFGQSEYRQAAERWGSFHATMRRADKHRGQIVIETSLLHEYPAGLSGFMQDIETLGNAPEPLAYYPIAALSFQRKEAPEERWIPLEQFSSGERALFFRFLGLIREVTDGSLVLIDEPEIHLHPAWVQRFVGLLVTLFRKKKVHVLIASHSPLIAADVPADCILGLKKDGDQIHPYPVEDQSLGTAPSVILREVFAVQNELGEFTRQIIERVREHIQEGEYRKALALYDLLGDSHEKFKLFRELRQLQERGN